jgi:hypothetical protein
MQDSSFGGNLTHKVPSSWEAKQNKKNKCIRERFTLRPLWDLRYHPMKAAKWVGAKKSNNGLNVNPSLA